MSSRRQRRLPPSEPQVAPVDRAPIGIVLLTFNSAGVIRRTLTAAQQVTRAITAVDSGSTDGTRAILAEFGCRVLERPFENYADQRNWAIDRVSEHFEWQLHLDADEVLDEHAIEAVRGVVASNPAGVGFIFHRRTHFLGRPLRFGGTSNWHLRLFRSGTARCEDRLYDQHFVTATATRRLPGWLDDLNVGSLSEWTARHNRWSTLEAQELTRPGDATARQVAVRLSADPRERRRLYKGVYYRAPRLLRALALFAYRYIGQLGFLDGRRGFIYCALWAFWFRLLVDAKLIEAEADKAAVADGERAAITRGNEA